MEPSRTTLPPEAYQELPPARPTSPTSRPRPSSPRSRSAPSSGACSCPCSSPSPSPTWG
ncbi:MAG: hypothetical protein M0C28_15150 [Candidatus Moduliflexus flocculans]|nr:hypothetical protein [Candidatus Moduliflexus flocculans]